MMPSVNQPPTVIDARHRVGRLRGAGGMGAVHVPKRTDTRRASAVKVILADAGRRPQPLERFMCEASAQCATDPFAGKPISKDNKP